MPKTGIVWDERYLAHDTGTGHPESPRRLLAIKEVLDTDSTLVSIPPRLATKEEVGWVHSKEHIENVEKTRGVPHGYFDLDTPVSADSAEAAFLAVGGLLTAAEAVFSGKVDNAFAFPRPPGHHAESTRAMGFCLFNNIAVAAEYLVRQKGLKRIAIVDIDVHHGNGTQHFFYARDDVFYVSTHRYPFYPGTGAVDETGTGKGKGYTLNLPFDALGDDDDYAKGYDKKILPALHEYKPEFVLVSAGFDAHRRDPLGGMKITKGGFKMMARNLFDVAQKYSGAKIVFVLEGGYDMKGLQEGVEAVLEVIHA
ncbi:MAG: histone deacetylase [Deltaproteobacteria bacterium]|nr:histone deacetylase [Deltaproteobacteria bacterium]